MPNLTALNCLLLWCAIWRVSYMLAHESGPFKLFIHIRDITRNWQWINFDCQNCTSVWAAALLFVVLISPLYPLVWILGASGGALMLGSYTGVDYVGQRDES